MHSRRGIKQGVQIILGYELPYSWDCWTALAKMNNKHSTRGLQLVSSALADCGITQNKIRRLHRAAATPRGPNVKNRTNLRPLRTPLPPRPRLTLQGGRGDLPPMTLLGGCGRYHPTPHPSQNITVHKRGREKYNKMWFAPKSSQVLGVWRKASLCRSWTDLPQVPRLLMAYLLSSPSATSSYQTFLFTREVYLRLGEAFARDYHQSGPATKPARRSD